MRRRTLRQVRCRKPAEHNHNVYVLLLYPAVANNLI
jgi:hypothetical protein